MHLTEFKSTANKYRRLSRTNHRRGHRRKAVATIVLIVVYLLFSFFAPRSNTSQALLSSQPVAYFLNFFNSFATRIQDSSQDNAHQSSQSHQYGGSEDDAIRIKLSNLEAWETFLPMHGFPNPTSLVQLQETRGEWLPLQQLDREPLQEALWLRIKKESFTAQCQRSLAAFNSWMLNEESFDGGGQENSGRGECQEIYLYSGKWNFPYSVYIVPSLLSAKKVQNLQNQAPLDQEKVSSNYQTMYSTPDETIQKSLMSIPALIYPWRWISIPPETGMIVFHVQGKGLSDLFLRPPWFTDKHSSWISLLQEDMEILLIIFFYLLMAVKVSTRATPSKWILLGLILAMLFLGLQFLQSFWFPPYSWSTITVMNGFFLSSLFPFIILLIIPSFRFFSLQTLLYPTSLGKVFIWGKIEKVAVVSFCMAFFLLFGPFPFWLYSLFFGGALSLVVVWLVFSQNFSRRHLSWEVSALAVLALTVFSHVYTARENPVIQGVPFLFWAMLWFIWLCHIRMAMVEKSLGSISRKFVADRQKATKELKKAIQGYSRFVPREFIRTLQKEKITELALGDNIEIKVTIMVADMYSFTTLSENMSPSENFRFVNSYLATIGPVIRQYQGFVLKFLGDGLMALFPRKVEDAVHAAINMQKKLIDYNKTRKTTKRKSIRTGIGIHTGVVRLGTVGEKDRLQGDIFSDAANLASRIEGLTRNYGITILMSQDSKMDLQDYSDFDMRTLDLVKVKGKEKETKVIEVLAPQIDPSATLKIASKAKFEQGFRALYFDKNYLQAIDCFEAVLSENQADSCAQVLLDRATYRVLNAGDGNQEPQQSSQSQQKNSLLRNL